MVTGSERSVQGSVPGQAQGSAGRSTWPRDRTGDPLHDPVVLEEIELYAELVAAAGSHAERLSGAEIDRLLRLRGDEGSDRVEA